MEDVHGLYQSNSNNKKQKPVPEEKELTRAVSGSVKVKKPSAIKRFIASVFGEDDAKSIKDYVVYDVIVPSLRNTIVDTIVNAVQMTFYGTIKGTSTKRVGNRTYVSYNGYSSSAAKTMSPTDRARHDFDTITIPDKGEAENVLTQMISCIEEYGSVSVSDFYTLVGIESIFVDKKWGWTDLSSAYIFRVRDGYVIKLPKTALIN